MSFKLAFSTIRYKPDLDAGLAELKQAGWDGWRLAAIDWLGTPQRVRRAAPTGMPMAVYTRGSPDNCDVTNVEEKSPH